MKSQEKVRLCFLYNMLLVDYSRRWCGELQHLLDHNKSQYVIGECVFTSSAALTALHEKQFAVIVVFTERYDTAGLWLCQHIRKISDIPILLLGGRDHYRLVRKAMAYQVNDYLSYPVHPSALLNSLLGMRTRLNPEPTKQSPPTISPFRIDRKAMDSSHVIRLIKAYVRDHLGDEITLRKISDMLHFNCAYLGQKFKLEENISFTEYLLQQRMEKAKQLLSSTSLRIYEIAVEVGYKDIDWFYKRFKTYTGSSPNAYRRQKTHTA
ncbi:helix-turn-helix domain-containing protein [Paenibacillus sp. FSL K6-0108]|uniref:helix-turn-helix domain-containing protein n=1 Tax=Paenibacillus sp. FSL K6-0108 TaxID=2921417 RepID=UPI003254115C